MQPSKLGRWCLAAAKRFKLISTGIASGGIKRQYIVIATFSSWPYHVASGLDLDLWPFTSSCRTCRTKLSSVIMSFWTHNLETWSFCNMTIKCLCNAVVTSFYMWNKIISKLFQPLSTSVWYNIFPAREKFHTSIAPHEYIRPCSMPLK